MLQHLKTELHEKTSEMVRMNENIVKLEAKGFQDFCKYVRDLEEKNKTLEKQNRILSDELSYFKEQCADLEDTINNLPKKYIHQVDESRIMSLNDLVISLADLGDFNVYEVLGYNDEHEGYIFDLKHDDFLRAELAAESHEAEIVSAMGSYGDDF